jgi:hypothetical protein
MKQKGGLKTGANFKELRKFFNYFNSLKKASCDDIKNKETELIRLYLKENPKNHVGKLLTNDYTTIESISNTLGCQNLLYTTSKNPTQFLLLIQKINNLIENAFDDKEELLYFDISRLLTKFVCYPTYRDSLLLYCICLKIIYINNKNYIIDVVYPHIIDKSIEKLCKFNSISSLLYRCSLGEALYDTWVSLRKTTSWITGQSIEEKKYDTVESYLKLLEELIKKIEIFIESKKCNLLELNDYSEKELHMNDSIKEIKSFSHLIF